MDRKVGRVISIYSQLMNGKIVRKREAAEKFEVNERTIQRDIDDIRAYFANDINVNCQVVYDRTKNGYTLISDKKNMITSYEVLMICKVFLESEALLKNEMLPIIDKLIRECVPYEEQKKITTLVNERITYKEPVDGRPLDEMMRVVADAIFSHHQIQIWHKKASEDIEIERIVCPVGIMFSNNHFYLTGYVHIGNGSSNEALKGEENDELFPAIYKMNEVVECVVLDKTFHVPYKTQVEDQVFRERLGE